MYVATVSQFFGCTLFQYDAVLLFQVGTIENTFRVPKFEVIAGESSLEVRIESQKQLGIW